MTKGNPLRRIAPIAVLTAALSFSAWSLYFVARHLGAPIPVAVVVSTIFDGGAVYLADLAADHTREGDSGFGPRFAVFILAGVSAWLNTLHAQYGGYPVDSELLWAAPPIVAVIVYEFTVRHIHRKTLRANGRIPQPLPRFDGMAWVLFPAKTLRSAKKIVDFRREVTTALATGEPLPGNAATILGTTGAFTQTGGTFGGTPGTFPQLTPNPRDVRLWAARVGIPVGKTGPIKPETVALYLQAIRRGELEPAPETEPDDSDGPATGQESESHLAAFEPEAIESPESTGEINGHEFSREGVE